MRVSVLLFFSIICMVHCTVFLKENKNYTLYVKDNMLSRSIGKSNTRIIAINPNFKEKRKKYKKISKRSIRHIPKKFKQEENVKNDVKYKRLPTKKISRTKQTPKLFKTMNNSGSKKSIEVNKPRYMPKKSIPTRQVSKLLKTKNNSRSKKTRSNVNDGKKIKVKRKKHILQKSINPPKNTIPTIRKTLIRGLACSQKDGECLPKKKSCNGVTFTGKKFCKNKNFVCCVSTTVPKTPSCESSGGSCKNMKKACKSDEEKSTHTCLNPKRFKCCMKKKEPPKPPDNEAKCSSLGGSCIKTAKSCKGEELEGAEYCQFPKRFKCCIKKVLTTKPTDCENKPDCSSLNGACIKQEEMCNGNEFIGKEYCTAFKKCKCCVKFPTIKPLVLTTFIPTTRATTIKPTEAIPHQATTLEVIIPTTAVQPQPTPPDLSCYRDMEIDGHVHTMLLPPNTNCNAYKSGVTEESKMEILKLHNQYRTKVALGQELRGDPGPQPPGSNIREIVWNDELAQIAQAWANQCPKGGDCRDCRLLCSRSYKIGQNAFFYGSSIDDSNWNDAITKWYDEVEDFDSAKAEKLTMPKPGQFIVQYTQMMWADTYEIGCGAVYFPHDVPLKNGEIITLKSTRLYICNYGPTGNYLNRPVYKIGEAASDCPNGVSSSYPALCA